MIAMLRVRGREYDTNTALGSKGLVLTSEIRTPSFHILGADGASDQLQFGIFVDYAYLDLQLDMGWQLNRPPAQLNKDTRAAIVVTVSF